MIRQLAQCPYCQNCEIALTDNLEVVFNPDQNPGQPCPHLIWTEGRYSQWESNPLPGRKTKIARMIGSTEFEWQHPSLAAQEDAGALWAYLKELVGTDAGRQSAPPEAHSVQPISRDHSITEPDGKVYPAWEIEGTALFAANAAAFMECLPACLDRQSNAWSDLPGQ
jgi:hypothetical protein